MLGKVKPLRSEVFIFVINLPGINLTMEGWPRFCAHYAPKCSFHLFTIAEPKGKRTSGRPRALGTGRKAWRKIQANFKAMITKPLEMVTYRPLECPLTSVSLQVPCLNQSFPCLRIMCMVDLQSNELVPYTPQIVCVCARTHAPACVWIHVCIHTHTYKQMPSILIIHGNYVL